MKNNKIDIYNLLTNLSIICLFITVGIAVMMCTFVIPFTAISLDCVLILSILCLTSVCVLPWIKSLQDKKHSTVAIISIIFSSIMCILLSISSILIVNCIFNATTLTENYIIGMLIFLKIVLIMTLQYLLFNLISICVIKYKTQYLPFQIIMYLSNLFVDFYITFFICCLSITAESGIVLLPAVSFLSIRALWISLVLAVTYVIISSSILKRIEIKRVRNSINKVIEDEDINNIIR